MAIVVNLGRKRSHRQTESSVNVSISRSNGSSTGTSSASSGMSPDYSAPSATQPVATTTTTTPLVFGSVFECQVVDKVLTGDLLVSCTSRNLTGNTIITLRVTPELGNNYVVWLCSPRKFLGGITVPEGSSLTEELEKWLEENIGKIQSAMRATVSTAQTASTTATSTTTPPSEPKKLGPQPPRAEHAIE